MRVGSGRSRSPREDAARRQDHSAATAAPCLCGRVVGLGSDYGAIPPLAGSFSDSVGGCSPVRANPSRHAALEQVRGGIGRWARKLFREAAPQSNRRVTGRVVYDWLARRREVACRWITISGDACPEFNEVVRPARPGCSEVAGGGVNLPRSGRPVRGVCVRRFAAWKPCHSHTRQAGGARPRVSPRRCRRVRSGKGCAGRDRRRA